MQVSGSVREDAPIFLFILLSVASMTDDSWLLYDRQAVESINILMLRKFSVLPHDDFLKHIKAVLKMFL